MEHLDTKPIGVTLRIIHPQTEYLLQTPQLIVIKNSKSHNWVFFSANTFMLFYLSASIITVMMIIIIIKPLCD